MALQPIVLKGVRVHNLKNVDLTLKPNELIVFTGVSGSGKSSLAFDTLFVEGQRRYVESLSTFARRFMGDLAKPDVERVSGLSPTISIEQKSVGKNPRSTVGTLTEIYDFLRVLYARVGTPHCPISGEVVAPQSKERIIKTIQTLPPKSKIQILAPFAENKKGAFKEDLAELLKKGFMRVRVDGDLYELEKPPKLNGTKTHNIDVIIDRIVVNEENFSRIADAIGQSLEFSQGSCRVLVNETQEHYFSQHAFSQKSGLSYEALQPSMFSFNSPSGMCPKCQGLGVIDEFDVEKIIDPTLSIAQGCCSIASAYNTVRWGNIYDNLAKLYNFSVHTPWSDLPERAKKIFLYGNRQKWTRMRFVHPISGSVWHDYVRWRGVLADAHKRYADATSDLYRHKMEKLMRRGPCDACQGSRLKPYPSATIVGGLTIGQCTAMTISEAFDFFKALNLPPTETLIAKELLKEIVERLRFLIDVGLHYLTLSRTSPTLSGGEAQRVRLAAQLGCGLVGVTYILDEPSIGLHPRDNLRLIETLKTLRDKGNTIVVVEHDEETILSADRVVDFGPLAGSQGGSIVFDGGLKNLLKSRKSLTGAYLSGRESIPIPSKRRNKGKERIRIEGAAHHNLKNVAVSIPLNRMVAVTGVSGSGKSSLIADILHPALAQVLHKAEKAPGRHKALIGVDALDRVIAIDQSPIGRNPRSNPATYIKLLDDIRSLFSQLPESRSRGYTPGRFSFNVKQGSCPRCKGMGAIKIDMDFLEDAWITCPLCEGKRFDNETLSILYKGKSIYEVLEMDVAEALHFFENIPQIRRKLAYLKSVGMDYIKLGQSSTTLSGGEAQRIKLARELTRPQKGHTLYILDEPTTGLHFHDVSHLLAILQNLVDAGNSVVVIEHNMEVVKCADWIIDLGPEGGNSGGKIVGQGTPEAIAKLGTYTGSAIKEALHMDRRTRTQQAKPKNKTLAKSLSLSIEGAEQNNLKDLSLSIPRNKLTIFTGPSGSGKSSLAFDTLYAEGQRRYTQSLSPYARQFVKQSPKPKVNHIEGLSPAIAIEQKVHAGNPRSTVGTMTEVYDYLRLLYARLGTPHCPDTGEVIHHVDKEFIANQLPSGRMVVLAPVPCDNFQETLEKYTKMGFRRLRLNGTYYEVDEKIPFNPRRKNQLFIVIDRLKATSSNRKRLLEAIEAATSLSAGKVTLALPDRDIDFTIGFATASGRTFPPITPHSFSFNAAQGMCPDCQGLGYQYGADLAAHHHLMELSTEELLAGLWGDHFTHSVWKTMKRFLKEEKIDPQLPLKELTKKQIQHLMNGNDRWTLSEGGLKVRWMGINTVLAKGGKAGRSRLRESVTPLLDETRCLSCTGGRLNEIAQNVTIKGKSLPDLCRLSVQGILEFIQKLHQDSMLEEVFDQLTARLSFLCEVGLQYISLDRKAPTLSGGETQRIRLARQLGSRLSGVLYVLDEPTIGLHPHDNDRLHKALSKLKSLGNTLVMVEHDPLTIATADKIVDFGPKGGQAGGHITAKGTLSQIRKNPNSLTGAYLSGKTTIAERKRITEPPEEFLSVRGARLHNLKNIDVDFPIGAMTVLTGVSGSGKSTLMNDIIRPLVERNVGYKDQVSTHFASISGIDHFSKVINVDQNPIGLTNRSDVCTYVDLLTPMRQWFASLPEARARGLMPKHFSYNHLKGMCTACWGLGYRRVELKFLPPVQVPCPDCNGLRLNPLSLEVTFHGKNLGEFLDMTIEQLQAHFEHDRRLNRLMDILTQVGLGYLKLGQKMATLSGGEAQRLKLARELTKRSRGKTLYLLDEPTTGLHSDDIDKLLKVLSHLVEKGNTVILIEHNLELISQADHIIDLGPDAGEDGGKVVAEGTPEELKKNKKSLTGQYLCR